MIFSFSLISIVWRLRLSRSPRRLISLCPLCNYKALSADLQDGPPRKNRKIFQKTMEKMNALHEKDGTHQKTAIKPAFVKKQKNPCTALSGPAQGGKVLLQQLLAGVSGTLEELSAVGLDHAGVGQRSQLRVDGAFGQNGQVMLCGHLVHMLSPNTLMCLPQSGQTI